MTIGSLRTRSSSTPACSDTSANGSVSSATRMPICSGVACSSSAAVNGSARLVICAPNDVIVSDSHSRRKSGSRHRPRRLRRAVRAMRSSNFMCFLSPRRNARDPDDTRRRKLRIRRDCPVIGVPPVPGGHPRGSCYRNSGSRDAQCRRRTPLTRTIHAPATRANAHGDGIREEGVVSVHGCWEHGHGATRLKQVYAAGNARGNAE